MTDNKSLEGLMEVVRLLRSEQGCPWDRVQTHESLKPYMLEEAYEVIEAVDQKDSANLCEELGDVLLQVALHSVIAEKQEKATVEEQYGELLFAVINLSTILGLNAENSLTNAVDKFINRFVGIERIASREGKRLSELSVNYENELWKLNNK